MCTPMVVSGAQEATLRGHKDRVRGNSLGGFWGLNVPVSLHRPAPAALCRWLVGNASLIFWIHIVENDIHQLSCAFNFMTAPLFRYK